MTNGSGLGGVTLLLHHYCESLLPNRRLPAAPQRPEVVGDWPGCEDLRAQLWRFVSYQVKMPTVTMCISPSFWNNEGLTSCGARVSCASIMRVGASNIIQCASNIRCTQFVHVGYSHLAGNVTLQLLFGLPVDLARAQLDDTLHELRAHGYSFVGERHPS